MGTWIPTELNERVRVRGYTETHETRVVSCVTISDRTWVRTEDGLAFVLVEAYGSWLEIGASEWEGGLPVHGLVTIGDRTLERAAPTRTAIRLAELRDDLERARIHYSCVSLSTLKPPNPIEVAKALLAELESATAEIERLRDVLELEMAALSEAASHAASEVEESARWRERAETFERRVKALAERLGGESENRIEARDRHTDPRRRWGLEQMARAYTRAAEMVRQVLVGDP